MKVPAGTRAKIEPQQIHCKKVLELRNGNYVNYFHLLPLIVS